MKKLNVLSARDMARLRSLKTHAKALLRMHSIAMLLTSPNGQPRRRRKAKKVVAVATPPAPKSKATKKGAALAAVAE